jgi:hypothetical protein
MMSKLQEVSDCSLTALSETQIIQPNDQTVVNNKLEKMRKEAVAAYFMVRTFNLSAENQKNQEKSQVRVVSVAADILIAMRQLCHGGSRCFEV